MPILVTLQLPKGREYKSIEKSMEEVTEVVSRTLNEPLTNIRVTVREVELNRYSVGGILKSEENAIVGEEK